MASHELLTIYAAKAVEYLLAVSYLLFFVLFWRYVNGRPAALKVAARQPARLPRLAEWFRLAEGALFHPGHAWARVEGPDVFTVGLDDFAGKLVGSLSAIELPAVGTALGQGEKGWTLQTRVGAIDMLSPVDGTVLAVNQAVVDSPRMATEAPYEDGWLLKIKSGRLAANVTQLLSGSLAHRWMEDITQRLRGKMGLELGLVYEDGGHTVDGFARILDPEHPDLVAKRFFLTDGGGSHA
jgi:glycine cleavage system H protein